MQYKEFDFGDTEIAAATAAQWNTGFGIATLQQSCPEHLTCGIEIQATIQDVFIRFIGGHDSLSQQLYSSVYSTTRYFGDSAFALGSAESASNVSIRLKIVEGVFLIADSYGTAAKIAVNTSGFFYFSTADMQDCFIQLQAKTAGAIARPIGILKGSLEGISAFFEVVTDATGFTSFVDCRAYGFAGFEVKNTGSVNFTGFQIEFRRHSQGVVSIQSFSAGSLISSNPISRLQRVRGSFAPATLPAGSSIAIDYNISDIHSFRFKVLPTTAQATIKGILKG